MTTIRLPLTSTTIRDSKGRAPKPTKGWLVGQLTINILSCYDAANADARLSGGAWYPRAQKAAKAMSTATALPLTICAGVLAALSPRNRWSRNVTDAAAMAVAFVSGGTVAASAVKVCTFNSNKQKALAILTSDADRDGIARILSGRKLTSFYGCIMGDRGAEVCIDGHAVSIALGTRITLDKTPSLSAGRYATMQVAYNMAAAARGVSAATMQAVTWVSYRTGHSIRN